MNVTDLQDILHERAATGAEERAHRLLAGVHQRYETRRRRRAVAGVAAGVVALAALGAVAVTRPSARVGPAPVVQPSIRTINGFPEYADGARIAASAQDANPETRQLSVTFTPRTLYLVFWTRCTGEGAQDLSVGGKLIASSDGRCGPSTRWIPPEQLIDAGLEIGKETTISFRTPGGPMAVAVGEEVPLAGYPFPPRPAELRPLQVGTSPGEHIVVRADPADPNRPVSVTLIWSGSYQAKYSSQTPGRLVTTVGGSALTINRWWDYEQKDHGTYIDPTLRDGTRFSNGDRVTVTVTPERMTGDWALVLRPLGDLGD